MTGTDRVGPTQVGKEQLRAVLRASRARWVAAASDIDVQERGRRLADAVASDGEVAAACRAHRVVTAFASMPGEPPTDTLLERLAHDGADLLLPVVRPNRCLHWARYSGADGLRPGVLGTREPIGPVVASSPAELASLRPAILLVPALAVDSSGARLGHGGGYYDTLLADLVSERIGDRPTLLALVGADEVLPSGAIPTEPHDRGVDRWLTG